MKTFSIQTNKIFLLGFQFLVLGIWLVFTAPMSFAQVKSMESLVGGPNQDGAVVVSQKVRGNKLYEATNLVSSTLSVVSDRKLPQGVSGGAVSGYQADVISTTDQYAYGMVQVDRNMQKRQYRYGFNGHEEDDEVKGDQAHISAMFWDYDPRVATRFNIDPVVKYQLSPYNVLASNPIWFADSYGADTSFADATAREEFVRTIDNINCKVLDLNTEIQAKTQEWKKGGYKDKALQKKIGELNEMRSQVLDMQDAFNRVITAKEEFHYTAKPNPKKVKFGGAINYNTKEDRYDITFKVGNSTTITHETTHGRQVLNGEIKWGKGVTLTDYDYADEFEAFTNGFNYGRIFNGWKSQSKKDIEARILRGYSKKSYIRKDFTQNCEDGAVCK